MWFLEDKKIYQELTFSVPEGIVGTYVRKKFAYFCLPTDPAKNHTLPDPDTQYFPPFTNVHGLLLC